MSRKVDQGDVAETAFLARATREGFQVSSPYGLRCRYDSILDNGLTRYLIQVKSTRYLRRKDVYVARTQRQFGRLRGKRVPYVESEIDFLVAYLIPEETWYIIPIEAVRGKSALYLYSRNHKKKEKAAWEPFRENWDLFEQHQTPNVAKLMAKIRTKREKD